MTEAGGEILIVDDETHVADLFGSWLEDEYEVTIAYDGLTAIDKMSDSVELVLLDRDMPDLPGDEVLRELHEQGYDPLFIMVTSVEPDFDIVDLGFDEYLTKPTNRSQLLDVIERVRERPDDENVRKYHSTKAKRELLETEKSQEELETSGEYQELVYQEVVRQCIEDVFNANDTDAIDDICLPDVTTHGPGGETRESRAALKAYQDLLHETFDDLRFDTEVLFAENGVDMVAIRGTFEGTHVGPFKGIEPTGKTISWQSHYFFRVRDGKLAEIWALPDTYGIVEQLQEDPAE